jgi:2-C-methyl-D-erythritol 4-phosphate cytidylyltransferase/2-C-methyl-D-erythritol 2,4-cyclodiphosphate synthase
VTLVLAAGMGERLGVVRPKAFLALGPDTLLTLSARAAAACPDVESLVIAVPRGFEEDAGGALPGLGKPVTVVAGGETRHESVRLALAAAPAGVAAVVCHDAARPFASPALFGAVLAALREADGVVPVVPIPDTVKRVREGMVVATEPREELWLAQTPQAFSAAALRDSHERAAREGRTFTDDAALLEWAGYRVAAAPGEPGNFKVTTAEDVERALAALGLSGPARRWVDREEAPERRG